MRENKNYNYLTYFIFSNKFRQLHLKKVGQLLFGHLFKILLIFIMKTYKYILRAKFKKISIGKYRMLLF